ncbi:alpha/beta hydrolase [Cohnella sp. JJ-181]|uniref:alpha/beta hydrolase n=1 Tax=Cohnella rhizoplanae TaxID=2974897 RepID=UPI0022FF60D9|nr:alpha/beta fold hydrolase [Cohnella sp. JJ-181]CAI6087669.1 Pimeloyl-[acyl-carrier protein] methyl ester esterase [Cohnella sp. JJ-181]
MNESDNLGTILWLTGWSMPDSVFDRLRESLPDFEHVTVDYCEADNPEKMILLTESAVRKLQPPTLIGGWSLGGLLALRLAAKGLADGLLLFAAPARFTRPCEESDLGWADAYVRQMIAGLSKDREAVETKFRRMLFTESEREAGIDQNLPPCGGWTISALIAGLEILRGEEVLSQLNHVCCPVFLVHGAEDKICPYNAALELISLLPQAMLHTILFCGHAPFVGREEEIVERFRRWWHEQSDNRNSASI